jgi:hypothetical protein
MDFLATVRMLMDMQNKYPLVRHRFEDGVLIMEVPVDLNVPQMFEDAAKMFEPID